MSKIEITPEYMIFKDRRRDIQWYAEMNTNALVHAIERGLVGSGTKIAPLVDLADALYDLLPAKYRKFSDYELSDAYVVSLFYTNRGRRFAYNLMTVLCKERLSKLLDEIAQASYLQQVDYLGAKWGELTRSHEQLVRYDFGVSSDLVGVFILHLGIDRLCSYSKGVPT